MSKYKFIKPKPVDTNFVKRMIATNTKKPVVNTLSSGIMSFCNKFIIRNNKKIYCEIPSTEIVRKFTTTLNKFEKRKKLLQGFFTQKEEFKILVYTELYKLCNLGYLKEKKYGKYNWYKLTEKGIKYRYKFTELDLAEDMIKYFKNKGCIVSKVEASSYVSNIFKKSLNDNRDYKQTYLITKKRVN